MEKQVEEVFEKLKKEGKNDVDHLVQWMKDYKIIDGAKATEDKARALFKNVSGKQKVELSQFKEALNKFAVEHDKDIDALLKKGEKIPGAVGAGAAAFKKAMK